MRSHFADSTKNPLAATERTMDLAYMLLLGVVQGIAEFLPISSSGHLVILSALTHQQADIVAVNIALHLGTLGSILVVYRRQIRELLARDRRVIAQLVVATLPAVFVGLPLHQMHSLRSWMSDPLLVGCLLPVTGLLLIAGDRLGRGHRDYRELGWGQAFVVGLFQAVAILPGISRSGSTIVGGLLMGLRPEAAATFSFLLAIPAISGAAVLELKDLAVGTSEPAWQLAAGAAVSFVVGLAALVWLIGWIRRGRLAWFAAWCIPVGLAVIVWQLLAASRGIAAVGH